MINIGGLWKHKSKKDGKSYLQGSINGAKLLVFPNQNKTKENQPDYNMFLVEKEKQEDKK